MDKISLFVIAFFFCLTGSSVFAQNNHSQVVITNNQHSSFFLHTIERGQTVYAIATMYGVTPDDIYRLNPNSKEGIKAGSTLKIPQQEQAINNSQIGNYTFHTIQPKETLYALSIRYGVPGTAIIKANPGLSTATFTIGKTIRIPATQIEDLPTTENKEVIKEVEYTIQKRETMYRLCRKFDISSSELIKLNPQLKKGVKAGMTIKIPVKTQETVTTQPQSSTMSEREVNDLLSSYKRIEYVNQIKVALFLPFMANETIPSAESQRFLEYYEGFLLAVDSLRNMGSSIELSVYDTGKGTKKLKEILQNESLKNVNLIIGAVQNDQIGVLADYSQKNNIKYVIPFTSKNDDVLSNANIYQVNTPHSYLYDKAAQAGCQLFKEDNIILLRINDGKDKTDFIKAFKAEMKSKKISFKEITYKAETLTTDIELALDSLKRNVIVPTSGSSDALNNIKSPIRMLAETKPEFRFALFGYPEWQTYTRDCLEDFYALDTYIYCNFYANNLSKEVHDFYYKYKNWYSKSLTNTFPKYGILGFDTGMFFLTAINKYGSNFENNLHKINYQGIQTEFDFHRVNNWGGFVNTHIFIVHYQKDFHVTRNDIK